MKVPARLWKRLEALERPALGAMMKSTPSSANTAA